jgi:hypothetical protein
MCGLVGVAGRVNAQQDKVFKTLLYIDALRGFHSTGTLFVGNNKHAPTTVLREAVDASKFIKGDTFNKELMFLNRVLMGHNRYATVGDVTSDNAHPFKFDSVIGAHNGTLNNQALLPDSDDFEVDSKNLYHSIDKLGLEDTYSLLLGAWALSWWDTKNKSMNFIRNEERPMSYCYSLHGDTLYWASERGMLEFALNRSGIKYGTIVSTKPHHLYTIPVHSQGLGKMKITDLSKKARPKVVPMRKKTTSTQRGGGNAGNKYSEELREYLLLEKEVNPYGQVMFTGEMYHHPYEKVCLFLGKGSQFANDFSVGDLVRSECLSYSVMRDMYNMGVYSAEILDEDKYNEELDKKAFDSIVGYNGEMLTQAQFKARDTDCSWCSDPLEFTNDLTWITPHSAICTACKDVEDVKLYLTDATGTR